MDGWLLQDWVTIRATNSGGPTITSVPQGSSGWIDVGDYEDFSFFLDIRELTNGANQTIFYETSPSEQESSFRSMASFTPAVGQRVTRILSANAAIPPARFIRWRCGVSGAGDWDITFRIWLAAYPWVKS
jgi:hypothetical protein